MSKLLAALMVSAFAFGGSALAADTAKKKEELTKEQRADMRNRAERLTAERTTRAPAPVKATPASAAKKQELTQEERAEMRNRAERLRAERDRGAKPAQPKL